ncbi:MAG: hypothetical protein E7262_07505 [Lachnospiraceae bacterium]|nr:hypothetical protein [Lachnospiraceae bacterium]
MRKKLSELKMKMRKNPKKTKKILTAISTTMLSMLLLVSVTYAWFTLTNKPKIEGFNLKVGTTGKLEIAKEDKVYGNKIAFDEDANSDDTPDISTWCLKPLSTIDMVTFYKPSHRDQNGVVDETEPITIEELNTNGYINNTTANNGYLIKKEFYLKATVDAELNSKAINVKLVAGNKTDTAITGTYIYNKNEDKKAAAAVRVGFICEGVNTQLQPETQKVFLEPHWNESVSQTPAQQYSAGNGWTTTNPTTIKHNPSGTFYLGGTSPDNNAKETGDIFKIKPNHDTKVTMFIWLEGADKDCVNDIQGSDIGYSFQFISNDLE